MNGMSRDNEFQPLFVYSMQSVYAKNMLYVLAFYCAKFFPAQKSIRGRI